MCRSRRRVRRLRIRFSAPTAAFRPTRPTRSTTGRIRTRGRRSSRRLRKTRSRTRRHDPQRRGRSRPPIPALTGVPGISRRARTTSWSWRGMNAGALQQCGAQHPITRPSAFRRCWRSHLLPHILLKHAKLSADLVLVLAELSPSFLKTLRNVGMTPRH